MTVAEVAKFLGIEYDYVRRLIVTGRLKGRKKGRVWDVDEKSVRARSVGLRRDSTVEHDPDEVKTVIP